MVGGKVDRVRNKTGIKSIVGVCWLSVVSQWSVNGQSMVSQWSVNGRSMDGQWSA